MGEVGGGGSEFVAEVNDVIVKLYFSTMMSNRFIVLNKLQENVAYYGDNLEIT